MNTSFIFKKIIIIGIFILLLPLFFVIGSYIFLILLALLIIPAFFLRKNNIHETQYYIIHEGKSPFVYKEDQNVIDVKAERR